MVLAQQAWQPIPANAIFETGDTWNVDTQTYRLFGVQACIRGTLVTTDNGIKRDCGDLSLKMLTALVKAWNPLCAVVGFNSSTKYVVCYADIEAAGGRQRVELGTALISSGFAFAAQNALGGPVSISYWAAEREAERTRAGLWAYPDLPNPNAALLKALKGPMR
ncbi:thermonuclease family protein [Rhizobium sp. VS19-DR104.2]|uniref:thermonuclease family protein n=1 Tax=unclassified Rhizobium TaxID=2613769 RepID=UPI001CC45B85|nr:MULTISPECIES: thermonuclease family protein [unclassified Rhizobium]MBZ5762293.1 thermonuclease family protein [Rhizobium sp. VS19-DR96]MBZ5768309.1 thermonuclease family protein [Rhizobium sp. VS19-DR129.2]MBZ5775819.1 thermonuclease family protein [Rhizobium sp. VS19-DRK62.2]MBZ5787160.1 thermonuclease family protein [Rhizobium sp. VS19-DR121]MBZ5804235.1 thermonuclease family protein [Rhizobium sp. VS19-DR181]